MDYIQVKNINEGSSSCRSIVIDNPKQFLHHLNLVDCKVYKEEALDFSKLKSNYSVKNEYDSDSD